MTLLIREESINVPNGVFKGILAIIKAERRSILILMLKGNIVIILRLLLRKSIDLWKRKLF